MTEPAYHYTGPIRFASDDHELWKLVQRRLGQGYSFESIGAEIGCPAMELVEWMNWVYQPPKKNNSARSADEILQDIHTQSIWARPEDERRMAIWRKAKDGAAQALTSRS